jgi:hypothetical protein
LSDPAAALAESADTLKALAKLSGHAAERQLLKRNGGETRYPCCQPYLERIKSFSFISASYAPAGRTKNNSI